MENKAETMQRKIALALFKVYGKDTAFQYVEEIKNPDLRKILFNELYSLLKQKKD